MVQIGTPKGGPKARFGGVKWEYEIRGYGGTVLWGYASSMGVRILFFRFFPFLVFQFFPVFSFQVFPVFSFSGFSCF